MCSVGNHLTGYLLESVIASCELIANLLAIYMADGEAAGTRQDLLLASILTIDNVKVVLLSSIELKAFLITV